MINPFDEQPMNHIDIVPVTDGMCPVDNEEAAYAIDLENLEKEIKKSSSCPRTQKQILNETLTQDDVRKNARILRMRKRLREKAEKNIVR